MQQQFVLPAISDDEAAYLAMHFGAVLEQNAMFRLRLRVVVACPLGMGSSRFLASRLGNEFPSLQAIVDYRKGLSQQMETLAAQRAEIVKQMRRKDAPSELADRRAMLTCKIAELRKEDKIAEEAIKRIQRTRESNRIDRENRMPQHPRPRRRRREQERE